MSGHYPPGVTGSEPEIQGATGWEAVHELIDATCQAKAWSDCDAFLAWSLGTAALVEARKFGAVFPSDSTPLEAAPVRNTDEAMQARALFWDLVNNYAMTCGGNPAKHVHGNTQRQKLVAEIEQLAFPNPLPEIHG